MEQQGKYSTANPIQSDNLKKKFRDTDMQIAIGWILRIGVIVSMVVVSIGGVLFIYRHGHSVPNYHTFTKIPDFISEPRGILLGVLNFKGQAIIQLGIILLVATPVLRVIFAAIGFLIEKDYLYVLISVMVLLIITISMISGHAG
ncbi:MAG: DUF1634 domain-containing protein [Mucilaginibacter sp.]